MRNVSVLQTNVVHVPHERQERRPHKEFTTACIIHLISMGTSMTCAGTSTSKILKEIHQTVPPYCGTGSARKACARSSAPRCAAGPCPPRLAARAPSGRPAATLSWLSSVPVGRRERLTPTITAVMKGSSQLHAHAHPLVSKKRAEPALPPPPCGARNKGA